MKPKIDLSKCFIARKKWSDFYKRGFYSTSLTTSKVAENGDRLVINSNSSHTRAENTPQAKAYFGEVDAEGIGTAQALVEFTKAPEFAYIIADEASNVGKFILPIGLFKKLKAKQIAELETADETLGDNPS